MLSIAAVHAGNYDNIIKFLGKWGPRYLVIYGLKREENLWLKWVGLHYGTGGAVMEK